VENEITPPFTPQNHESLKFTFGCVRPVAGMIATTARAEATHRAIAIQRLLTVRSL
jgi:hypothetical protein